MNNNNDRNKISMHRNVKSDETKHITERPKYTHLDPPTNYVYPKTGIRSKIEFFEKINEPDIKNEDVYEPKYTKPKRLSPYLYSTTTSYDNDTRCPVCDNSFNSEVALNDHYLVVHTNNYNFSGFYNAELPKPIIQNNNTYDINDSDEDEDEDEDEDSDNNEDTDKDNDNDNNNKNEVLPYKCYTCNLSFSYNIDLLIHNDNVHAVDRIPTSVYGKYECPLCENKYHTSNMLGEHFIISHNNYDDYCQLDEIVIHSGFPGFDILELIGMIYVFGPVQIEELIKNNESCSICLLPYCDGENIRPLKFECCNAIACNDCIENYINTTDCITCPFCKKDHTRTDLDYIVIYEMTDDIDKNKWINWWQKHVDILY